MCGCVNTQRRKFATYSAAFGSGGRTQRGVTQGGQRACKEAGVSRVKPSELDEWLKIYKRAEVAAICDVAIGTVATWHRGQRGVPAYAKTMLKLYSGELSQAQWEDDIEERRAVIAEAQRAQSFKKAQERKERERAYA